MVFMFLSSIHFGMTYMAFATRSLKPFKNEVLRFYLAILLLGTTVVTLSLKFSDIEPAWGGALLSGSFHVFSYVSTTGFGIADNSAWPALPSMILLIGGIFCVMAGSTTGGIKSDRALLFFKQIGYNIKKALHPASIHEIRVNGRVVRQEDVTAHILYIALYFMAIVISLALCLIMSGDNGHAFMATLSSLSNVGPAVGDLGTFGNFSAEPVGAKIIYTLDMFLGRVEIYPVLAVLMMLSGRTSK
jgi:trk system potassium uptake protein TrkH